jgi:transposase
VHERSIEGKTIVAIDPNKEDIISAIGEGLKPNPDKPEHLAKFRYTKCQKNFETRSRADKRLRNKMAEETLIDDPLSEVRRSVKQLETSIPTRKTADPYQFMIFLKEKIRVSYLLSSYYRREVFRKMKWHTYINTQRSEAKMLNNFASIYGESKDVIVCFGDYDQGHLKHCEPVKGKYYRDLFQRSGYEVYLVDEYKTSITCHDCEGRLEHVLKRRSPRPWVKSEKEYPVHGLFGCKTCLGGKRRWNRDLNASRNILRLALCAFHGQERPECFRRKVNQSGPAIAGQETLAGGMDANPPSD